jgi:UDP-glucose 4-epimerase
MPALKQGLSRILVTGGAGFIGSAVIAELQRHDCEIAVVDDLSFGNRDFIQIPDPLFHKVNILDQAVLARIVHDFDPHWILHLAAVHFIPWCNQHPYESADINIRGTQHLLDAAAKLRNLQGVLFASTAAVYPICDVAVDEAVPTAPLDIYGLSKVAGERLMSEFHLRTGVPSVVCRFFNAFGPNETNPHLIPEVERQLNAGARTIRLGNLAPKRDFIHTSDMARAVRSLVQQFTAGTDTFNLGRGEEYSVTEIVESFERALGEKITIEVDPARVRKTDRMHLLADIAKLKAFTGWAPQVSLDEGIATLIHSSAARP